MKLTISTICVHKWTKLSIFPVLWIRTEFVWIRIRIRLRSRRGSENIRIRIRLKSIDFSQRENVMLGMNFSSQQIWKSVFLYLQSWSFKAWELNWSGIWINCSLYNPQIQYRSEDLYYYHQRSLIWRITIIFWSNSSNVFYLYLGIVGMIGLGSRKETIRTRPYSP